MGALGIGDHKIVCGELVFPAIERGEGFPLVRKADDQSPLDFTGIKGVQRLSRLEHHEIRDINDVVNGAEADGLQTFAEPLGARPNLHPVDAADTVEGCGVGSGNGGDGSILFRGGKRRRLGNQFSAAESGGFPSHSNMT